MARRIQEQGGVTATIFFPAGNVEELTLNAFREFTQALTEGGQVESSGPASDPDVRRVLAGLIHVESVPLNEFTALTGSMRARNMLRTEYAALCSVNGQKPAIATLSRFLQHL